MKKVIDKIIIAIHTLIGVIIFLIIGPFLFVFQIWELLFKKQKRIGLKNKPIRPSLPQTVPLSDVGKKALLKYLIRLGYPKK